MGYLQVVALSIGVFGFFCCGKTIAGERFPISERVPFAATVGTGITLDDWAAIIGIVIAVATFFLNWYYQKKRLDLERERLIGDGQ